LAFNRQKFVHQFGADERHCCGLFFERRNVINT